MSNVTDDILRALYANKVRVLAQVDFSKAFDILNHEILHSLPPLSFR